jgi:hypothetical protein
MDEFYLRKLGMPFLRNAFSLQGGIFMMIFAFLFLMMLSGVVAGAVMFFAGNSFSVKGWSLVFSITGAIYSLTSIASVMALIYFFFSGNHSAAKVLSWYCMLVIGYNAVFTVLGIGSGSTNAVGYLFKFLTMISLVLIIRHLRNNQTKTLLAQWFSPAS